MSRLFHLMGIGGTAMASLAGLLQEAGHRVRGSDGPIYPPMSDVLNRLKVEVLEGYRPENLDPTPDVVVVGNAIPRGNPELEELLDRDLTYTSMPAVLQSLFLAGRPRLVVTGTHGKTTTTTLAAWILNCARRSPGWLVGGLPRDLPASHALGKPAAPFVVEGDEYDTAFFDKGPKFLHYRPTRVVINAVEYDHADIYPDLDAIELQFRRLVYCVPRSGSVVVSADDPGALRVSEEAPAPRVTFGIGDRESGGPPDYWAPEIRAGIGETSFRLMVRGEDRGWWKVGVPGVFNVSNALAALALTEGMAGEERIARSALASFRGVRRRLEHCGSARGVAVYDDFAHHPTAIAAAVAALRPTPRSGGRLFAVVEPRSWTLRRKVFEAELARALSGADMAIIAPVYQPDRLDDAIRLDPRKVADLIDAGGGRGWAARSTDEIIERLLAETRPGDAVLIMSNGGFDNIHRRLLAALDTGGRER